jgi:hypothetical protein
VLLFVHTHVLRLIGFGVTARTGAAPRRVRQLPAASRLCKRRGCVRRLAQVHAQHVAVHIVSTPVAGPVAGYGPDNVIYLLHSTKWRLLDLGIVASIGACYVLAC